MKNERKLTKGGFEDIYPEVVDLLLKSDKPDSIAVASDLSRGQWDCICSYLDDPNFNKIAQNLGVTRTNIYPRLSQGFTKLERWRKSR